MTANKIAEVFGSASPETEGQLSTVVEQIEHGPPHLPRLLSPRIHQAVREILTYLRNEACSNNLADFGLKKGLDHLAAVREKLLAVTGRLPLSRLNG